jgi:hypothetical protein
VFASKVAKPQTTAAVSSTGKLALQRSTLVGHRLGNDPVEQTLFLQRTIGNQETRRLLAQRTSSSLDKPCATQEQEADPASLTARPLTSDASWDFSKIPLHPPDRGSQPQLPSPLATPPLPVVIQAKLVVGQANDPLEHEANRIADQVMRMPDPKSSVSPIFSQLSSKCAVCNDEDEVKLHAKRVQTSQPRAGDASDVVPEVLRSSGEPLDLETRAFFEPRLGQHFSHVHVHTDLQAVKSARSINALAYTVGDHIVFGAPGTEDRKHLLAHELVHVMQQSKAPAQLAPIQRQEAREPEGLEKGTLLPGGQGFELTFPFPMPPYIAPPDTESPPTVPPFSPAPAPPFSPPSVPSGSEVLDFYHGTRWSIAQQIPGHVKPIGGGDFAAGFYTHYDATNSKALARAVEWGRQMARKRPAERYAGVVHFGVSQADYQGLFAGGKAKVFSLQSLTQPNYVRKQKEWLDFVTAHGREADPTFIDYRRQWVHQRRDPQPILPYNIIQGPFYTPAKGTADNPPKPEDFKPYAVGTQVPQQVLWANDGIALLNSSKVTTELTQYDAKTGERKEPPVADVGPAASFDIEKMTEEVQMNMGAPTTGP